MHVAFRNICFLLMIALFAACSDDDSMQQSVTTLTVALSEESSISESEFPVKVVVSYLSSKETVDSNYLACIGENAVFSLPVQSTYRISLTTQSGKVASVVTTLKDTPLELYIMFSGTENNDGNIDIPLDDTATSQSQPVWPEVLTMYDGHVIVFSDSIAPDSARITLLSLSDWSGLHSANSPEYSTEATQVANDYYEGNNTYWSIPTTEQARQLKTTYASGSSSLDRLNALLKNHNADTIALRKGNSNVRYLCDEARKSFSFVSGTNVANGGTSASDYHLRLVSTVTLRVR